MNNKEHPQHISQWPREHILDYCVAIPCSVCDEIARQEHKWISRELAKMTDMDRAQAIKRLNAGT